MAFLTMYFISLAVFAHGVHAYWRMSCGLIQTGRLDPVVNPGSLSGHVHKVSGANTFGMSSTFESLRQSRCTSCEITQDLSAYWTPQLYYRRANGTFQEVPNSGTVVYYLGRGDARANMAPFPAGFKILSGNTLARSYDSKTLTTSQNGRPISDRTSFACISSKSPFKETPGFGNMDCDGGMRAQIQFQSCWDGNNLYKTDNSHVAYMSQIDNGVCPSTHPILLPHLFYEIYYGVNDVDKSDGGYFAFANGDPTGYGFHGDFINGWDNRTLSNGIRDCINKDSITNPSACPAFNVDPYAGTNCPEQPPIVNEKVKGFLDSLPNCKANPITFENGTQVSSCSATAASNNTDPATLNNYTAATAGPMYNPQPGSLLGNWSYVGCAKEADSRVLGTASYSSDAAMTIESCQAYCSTQNLALAGLEYSKECWCSNSLASMVLDASNCDSTPKMICSGNSSEWCGGPNLLTIWNNTHWTSPVPVIGQTTIQNGKSTYAGCFTEVTGIRTLSKASTSGNNNSVMTNELCGGFCMSLGYSLAGTEYSHECFCGNSLEIGSTLAANTDCSMPCAGDSKQLCGGGNRLSVWNATAYLASAKGNALSSTSSSSSSSITSIRASATITSSYSWSNSAIRTSSTSSSTPSPSTIGSFANWTYLGCFSEATSGRALRDSSNPVSGNKNTIKACAAACSGYSFFGVEWSVECYCGNKIWPGAENQTSSNPQVSGCNMVCGGDSSQYCGGSNRLNVYKAFGITSSSLSFSSSVSTSSITSLSPSSALSSSPVRFLAASTSPYSSSSNTSSFTSSTPLSSGLTAATFRAVAATTFSTSTDSSSSLISPPSPTVPVSTTSSRSSSSTSVSPVTTTPPILGYYLLGCISEPINSKALPTLLQANDSMTPELCLRLAQSYPYTSSRTSYQTVITASNGTSVSIATSTMTYYTSFPFVGLEYSTECWAATAAAASPTSLVGDKACTMACNGDGTKSCGGAAMFNYWVTSASVSAVTRTSFVTSSTGGVR